MTSTVPALGTRTAEGSALQAVLLDMDGTLVDTEGFWWDAEVDVFGRWGTRSTRRGAKWSSVAP